MTPEAQRISIALACGWKKVRINDRGEQVWEAPPTGGAFPDYLNDLDAMHEAENDLTINQSRDYLRLLQLVSRGSISDAEDWMKCMVVIHATAAQRAEAFLRAIGKFEP